jgi:hypothetical protein
VAVLLTLVPTVKPMLNILWPVVNNYNEYIHNLKTASALENVGG